MPVRLIDPKATTDIEVSGTKFTVKQLPNGPELILVDAQRRYLHDCDEKLHQRLIDILATVIVGIDYPDVGQGKAIPTYEEFLKRLCFEDFLELLTKTLDVSALSKDEAKN